MTHKARDLVAAVALAILATAIFWIAYGIEARFPTGVDSGFFPEIVSLALLIAAVIIGITGARREREEPDDSIASSQDIKLLRVAMCVVLLGTFVFILPLLGFVLSSLLFLLAQIAVLAPPGQRSWPFIVLVSIVAAGGIYAVFSMGFGLILPHGLF